MYPVSCRVATLWEHRNPWITSMEGRDFRRVLDLVNKAIPDSHADLSLSEGELFHLVESGALGPPARLTPEGLLRGLLRHIVNRLVTCIPPGSPRIAPSLTNAERGRMQYAVRVVSPGPVV